MSIIGHARLMIQQNNSDGNRCLFICTSHEVVPLRRVSIMEYVSIINILSCFCAIAILFLLANEITATGEVVFAVNCGGPDHTDLNGVHYQGDKLSIGTASDFGKRLTISRVAQLDQILYQTERYHLSNFAYDIPIKDDGDYVLVLKFCEVYFQGPKLKVTFSFSDPPPPPPVKCLSYKRLMKIVAN